MKSLRRIFAAALPLALVAWLPLPAAAQPYPNRAIRIIVPFTPGSVTDAVGRLIAEDLQKSLGQPVIIDNQAGADGIISAQKAKAAAPDGYTLYMGSSSPLAFNPAFYTSLPYDPQKDFDPVAGLFSIPMILGVRKDFPADDLAGFLKIAKERPAANPVSIGTGNASGLLATELLKGSTKIPLTHVPYKGTPQALQDVVGGQVDALFVDPLASAGFVKSGQIKGLALTDIMARAPMMPNVPTMAEAGHKEVAVVSFAGIFVPAKTDPAIIERLSKEINKVLEKPQTKEFIIQKAGATPLVMTPAELRRFVDSEIVRWGKVVETAGIEKKRGP